MRWHMTIVGVWLTVWVTDWLKKTHFKSGNVQMTWETSTLQLRPARHFTHFKWNIKTWLYDAAECRWQSVTKHLFVLVLLITAASAVTLISHQFSYSTNFLNWPSELLLFPLLLVDESRLRSLSNLHHKCTSLFAPVFFKHSTSQGEQAFKAESQKTSFS